VILEKSGSGTIERVAAMTIVVRGSLGSRSLTLVYDVHEFRRSARPQGDANLTAMAICFKAVFREAEATLMIAKRIIDLVTLGERDPETAATHPPARTTKKAQGQAPRQAIAGAKVSGAKATGRSQASKF
jgi:hypothetical protein